MDISKITPAPWESRCFHVVATAAERHLLYGGREICHTGMMGSGNPKQCEADAAFIALARNAFDVMLRRGWGAIRFKDGWCPGYPVRMPNELAHRRWDDPFTALTEADKWYRENIEAKP
jgi:hypothetical protein